MVDDAQAIIQTAKLYEVQKYCSDQPHVGRLPGQSTRLGLPADPRSRGQAHQRRRHERADVLALNNQLQAKLAFNTPQPEPIREALRKAGFYASWKEKYGDKAWALLEQAAGRLS